MNAILGYLASHWRGEQPLWRAAIVNTILLYAVVIIALFYAGVIDERGIPKPDWVHLPVCIFMLWGWVGAVRSALVEVRRPSWVRKVFAIAAIGLAAWWVIEQGYEMLAYLWRSLT